MLCFHIEKKTSNLFLCILQNYKTRNIFISELKAGRILWYKEAHWEKIFVKKKKKKSVKYFIDLRIRKHFGPKYKNIKQLIIILFSDK